MSADGARPWDDPDDPKPALYEADGWTLTEEFMAWVHRSGHRRWVYTVMIQDAEYEWCVMHSRYPEEPHRIMATEVEARDWVKEAEADHFLPGVFYVARRAVGPWHQFDGSGGVDA